MPSAQDDRHLRVEALHLARDLHGLADHRAGDQGDRQADRVLQFLDHAPLEIRRDGGIDELHLVPGAQQGRRYGQDTQGRGRFLAGKGRKEEDYLFSLHRFAHVTRITYARGSRARKKCEKSCITIVSNYRRKVTYTDAGKQKPVPMRHPPTLLNRASANLAASAPVASEAAIRISMAPTQEFLPVPSAT